MKKDEFITIAKLVEAHIQHSESYETGIATGKFAERFDSAWEQVKNTVALGDISVSLDEAMSLIDDYLNAGFKDNRTKAHNKGKELYEKYYGKKYLNRNER